MNKMTADLNIRQAADPVEIPVVVDGVHSYGKEEDWLEPAEAVLQERLEWFRDQKLGLFMHWGLYSQIGSLESWPLADEESSWSYRDLTWDKPEECQKQYKKLNRSFNPIRFNPDEWAEIAADCGFRYFILTTKHHDGFCLWDTNCTQYKVTDPACPFSEHLRADICMHAFRAFRARGLAVTAYFSKADWNSPCYWDPELQNGFPTSRRVNYDPKEYPEKWKQFMDFTHAQILEIVERYGPLAALWLDAGWVSARHGEDLNLGALADKVRKIQPDILFVDRTVGGALENILTPECVVPSDPMKVPWESCVTLDRKNWGFSYEPDYYSARQIVHLLIDIVSKGGNLALNIGPQPDGRLPQTAVRILRQMGEWLKKNGEAIYGTRICEPYSAGSWFFTKNRKYYYAIRQIQEEESLSEMKWTIPFKLPVESIELLGSETAIVCRASENGITLEMNPELTSGTPPFAVAFRIHR